MASTKDAAATVEDIQRDMQALRDDMARLAAQVTGLLSEGGSEAIGKLKKRVGRMQAGLDESMADMAEAGERSRDALSDVSEHLGEALQESLQEHPVTTVALAVGLGFLFGTVWRR